MAKRAVFNDKGELIGSLDEAEKVEAIQAIENDPYWKSPIPKSERKHKRPARINWSGGRIAIVAVAILAILGCFYYIIMELMS